MLQLALVAISALAAAPERFAVVADTLYTMGPAGAIRNGFAVVRDTKIESVGHGDPPAGLQIVRARAAMPGLVDIHSHLGLWPVPLVESTSDGNESTNPVTPHLRAIDAFYADDPAIAAAVTGGTTTILARPGSANVIGGLGVLLKLKPGRPLSEMVVREVADIKMALEWNPILSYGGKGKRPATRGAVYAVAREAFVAAREYVAAWERYGRDRASGKADVTPPPRDLAKEALAAALRREMPVHIHTSRADEVVEAIAFASEFGLDYHLGHGEWGYLVASEVAKHKGRIVVGPRLFRPNPEAPRLDNIPAALSRAGVDVALTTDHPVVSQEHFLALAALAVRYGMDREVALRAVTIAPARFARIDERVGSIEPGKDADVVLLSGDPIEVTTRVERVYADGAIVFSAPHSPAFAPAAAAVVTPAVSSPAVKVQIPAPDDLFISANIIYSMDGLPPRPGLIQVRAGKIMAIKAHAAEPRGANLLSAATVMPALVAAPSTIGLKGPRGDDTNEISAATTPAVDALSAIDPFHPSFRHVREEGVGAALVLPGFQNVLGGHGGVVRTHGTIVREMAVRRVAGFSVGLGEVPKAVHATRGVSSRMGELAALRDALTRASESLDRSARARRDAARSPAEPPTPPPRNLDAEALAPLLAGDVPAFVRANRLSDILAALRTADDFNLRVVLVGGADAPRIAPQLAARRIPVLYGPLRSAFRTPELVNTSIDGPARLAAAGVAVGLAPDEGPLYAASGSRDLLIDAALAHRGGLPRDLALAAVTRTPAEIAGVGTTIGALREGMDADMLLLDGDPLSTTTRPVAVVLRGQVVFKR